MGPYAYRVVWCNGLDERITWRWFGHIERKKIEELVKKMYVNEIECPRREKSVV